MMDNKEIAKQIREWADEILIGGRPHGTKMRAFADRLEGEPTSPTLADLLTPEEAAKVFALLDFFKYERGGDVESYDISNEPEPPKFARVLHALWERAKEDK